MKIVLQHRQTKGFFKDTGTWTENLEEAREFPTAMNACFFSVHHGLIEVDIVETTSDEDRDRPYFVNVCA